MANFLKCVVKAVLFSIVAFTLWVRQRWFEYTERYVYLFIDERDEAVTFRLERLLIANNFAFPATAHTYSIHSNCCLNTYIEEPFGIVQWLG